MSPSLLAASLLLAGASLMPASPPTTAQGGLESPKPDHSAPAAPSARPSPSGTASPTAAPTAKPATGHVVRGIASWMPERYGASYLALPNGPGHLVKICAAACIVMRSTDAGPSLAMQRAGRVADIGVLAWERITWLDRSRGLAQVTVEALP